MNLTLMKPLKSAQVTLQMKWSKYINTVIFTDKKMKIMIKEGFKLTFTFSSDASGILRKVPSVELLSSVADTAARALLLDSGSRSVTLDTGAQAVLLSTG